MLNDDPAVRPYRQERRAIGVEAHPARCRRMAAGRYRSGALVLARIPTGKQGTNVDGWHTNMSHSSFLFSWLWRCLRGKIIHVTARNVALGSSRFMVRPAPSETLDPGVDIRSPPKRGGA